MSGRIEYRLECGFAGKGKPIHSADYRLSLMGRSWALRSPVNPGVAIDHRGMHLSYLEAKFLDGGGVHRVANIFPPEPIDADHPSPPYYAGTIWIKGCTKFIDEHRAEAKLLPGELREGVATDIVEWSVDKGHINTAFGWPSEALKDGGTLRLHVAPSLGYALPLIEYLDLSGKPQLLFKSSDFFEAAPDFFLPRRCEFRGAPGTDSDYYTRYDITNAELVNDVVPEEDFQMALALGTHINDSRTPGNTTVFIVGKLPVLTGDLPEIIRVPDVAVRSPWLRPILIGCTVGLSLVAIIVVLQRMHQFPFSTR
ncbi:MAG TPA: hypothetical protein VNH11_29020 [Pirellulales bacterium]|nr:hypothetical protein [Pirellulales bacterium]